VTCHNCKCECKKSGFFGPKRIQRYQCRQCGKKFSDIPARPLDDHRVPLEKAVQIIGMLLEGMGVRGCERLSGVHRDTILRLLETFGRKCALLHKERVKELRVDSVQVDEVFTRVRVLQRHATSHEEGDQYAMMGMSRETKLIIGAYVGKRDENAAYVIMNELRRRIVGRFQLTTDGFNAFLTAVGGIFYNTIDYAQQIKKYANDPTGTATIAERRYSPPRCVSIQTRKIFGTPYPKLISTSHMERQNLSTRHFNKRFCRLTLGYSKKIANLRHAVALYVAHHNFCRKHSALDGKTPAMAAKLTDHQWTIEELLSCSQ
jgi:transposase-like protein/IS1 family transposase